jgi:predicted MFS family arabinose efflux permease
VESRVDNAMLPLSLFEDRAFTRTNLLTLFLYAALAVMMFLIPLNLIQVRGFSATIAGAALLPFPIIMFALSRWSGGLVTRVGRRLPLTIGPAIAAAGLAMLAIDASGTAFWPLFLGGVVVLGLGMAVTVAPLTTTVMDSTPRGHSGVASGVNNAVSRVAGLLAIAAFGVAMSSAFERRVAPRLDELALPAGARAAVNRELPKMAGAELERIELSSEQRTAVHAVIGGAFGGVFRLAMIGAAVLAGAAACVGLGIGGSSPDTR